MVVFFTLLDKGVGVKIDYGIAATDRGENKVMVMRREGDPPPQQYTGPNGVATLVDTNQDHFDHACYNAIQLNSLVGKLSEMYLAEMALENSTVTLDSEKLAGIVNQLQALARLINNDFQRVQLREEIQLQRTNAVVCNIPFRTPTQNRTRVTAETIEEDLRYVENIEGSPLPKNMWSIPVQPALPTPPTVPTKNWWQYLVGLLSVFNILRFFRGTPSEVNISDGPQPSGNDLPGKKHGDDE